MKILVTGGLGFIGSGVCTALIERMVAEGKDAIYFYDNRTNAKRPRMPGAVEVFDFNREYDVVIHLAAKTVINDGIDHEMFETNIGLTSRLFARYKDSRIMFASSASVYEPNNQYAWTKQHNEWLAARLPDATCMRFFNVYGKNDNGVVGRIVDNLLYGKPLTIWGGKQTRDFVHVSDVVKAIVDNITSEEKLIEVGTGVATSVHDLMKAAEKIVGRQCTFTPMPETKWVQQDSLCLNPLKEFKSVEEGIKLML